MSIGPLFDAGFSAGQQTAMAEVERLREALQAIYDSTYTGDPVKTLAGAALSHQQSEQKP